MDSPWLTKPHPSIIKDTAASAHLIEEVYTSLPRNVRLIFAREISKNADDEKTALRMVGKTELCKAMQAHDIRVHDMLFHLARILDSRHLWVCKYHSASPGSTAAKSFQTLSRPFLDVTELAKEIYADPLNLNGDIVLRVHHSHADLLKASFRPMDEMSFNRLPVLSSLTDILPGEHPSSTRKTYIGIAGGGGSDIISASLVGHLLRPHNKAMNTLISIRTYLTGSQGSPGSQINTKRQIHNHGGPTYHNGHPIPGTYKITPTTSSSGRDLETIPLPYHNHIIQILDQTSIDPSSLSSTSRATLPQQLHATLSTYATCDSSILLTDTGGDIFGPGPAHAAHSTSDQDLRVLHTLSTLVPLYPNLTVAILAPGVDAPPHAADSALAAGGKIYHPSSAERNYLLHILAEEYHMDGRDERRFGKSNLALQAAWMGERGWVCLDLPGYVVDTEVNPWRSFVWVGECMEGIVFVGVQELVRVLRERGVLG